MMDGHDNVEADGHERQRAAKGEQSQQEKSISPTLSFSCLSPFLSPSFLTGHEIECNLTRFFVSACVGLTALIQLPNTKITKHISHSLRKTTQRRGRRGRGEKERKKQRKRKRETRRRRKKKLVWKHERFVG